MGQADSAMSLREATLFYFCPSKAFEGSLSKSPIIQEGGQLHERALLAATRFSPSIPKQGWQF